VAGLTEAGVLTDAQFDQIHALLEHGQTLDATGQPVDCGVRCGKFCCSPATTKYLLPGEGAYLERKMAQSGAHAFRIESLFFFDTFQSTVGRTDCICDEARVLRPFNCRAFPYAPTLDGDQVVGLHRNKLQYLESCWIERPGFDWARGAMRAWQIVLSDPDSRQLFAKMAVLWEWNQALDRGEEPGPVLLALAQLDMTNDAAVWGAARRFFHRTE
jgi:hypothetical protein